MSYYGGTITVAGRNLITSLIAGETIELTRVVVGSGSIPEGVEPIDMQDLVHSIAEASTDVPTVDNGVVYLTVEYRNDMNGGLEEGFWLREFGIYAKTAASEEILLYYATLGDSPQPVNAYRDNRIDIRRYPVSIELELDADVQVGYKPGSFVTSEEAHQIIYGMVNEAAAGMSRTVIVDIILPAADWQAEETPEKGFVLDYPLPEATDKHYPSVALHRESLETAKLAEVCPTMQSLNGLLRFWANKQPEADMAATVKLVTPTVEIEGVSGGTGGRYVLPIASSNRLGGVKIGKNVQITQDGTISVEDAKTTDFATDEEVAAMLEEVFNDGEETTD